ncbi:DUF4012 domain-containing protein [Bifidobacterium saguini]|nr:DUF4012 domain-containing protein [Bifidobacterium saguini]QTB90228.1 DUF4012 domain-containing protein [Bifidobacterium saguini]
MAEQLNNEGNLSDASNQSELEYMTDASIVSKSDTPPLPPTDQPDHHSRHRRRMSARHIRRIRRRRRIRRMLIGLGVVLLFVAVLAVWFAWSAMKTKNEVQQAVSVATSMQESLTSGDTDALNKSMEVFSSHASAAYDQTSSMLWKVASQVPYYGDDIRAVRTAVTAMENVSSQALPSLKQASSALNMSDVSVNNGTVDVSGLTKYSAALQKADTAIESAEHDLIGAPDPHIAQISDAMQKAKNYMHTLSGMVHDVNVAVQVAPKMLANDGSTRTYLILAQTNSEIRPGGGLPGSWGMMTVSGGKVELEPFISGSSIPWFDEPVVDLTAEERTLFTDKLGRVAVDVNFTPDFPRTGEIAKAMWKAHAGQDVDGVIAIDPVFLQNMLKVSGGVTLEDGVTLDGTNTAQYLLNQVYIDKPEDQQDAYFSAAAGSAFSHIMANAQDGKAFLKAVTTSVAQGHMKVWSAHEDEQELLLNTPISGALKTDAATPEVGVFFSDLTQSKMDWSLKRSVEVKFDKVVPDGANQYTVHVKLTNMMTSDEVSSIPQYVLGYQPEGIENGQIGTAVFAYAPAGGRLVDWKSTDGKSYDGVTTHNTLTVGVKKLVLSPGESYEATIHVEVAPDVKTPLDIYQTPQVEGRTDE